LDAVRVPSALSCPNEERYVSVRELDWSAVTLFDCERFVRKPLEGGAAPSQSTRRKRAYALKGFFDFLADHDVVEVSCALKLRGPGVQIGKPKPIPDDVWLAIWDQDMGMDDRVLLGLGYYLGLRRHEMIAIAPSHFNLLTRRVKDFPRKGGKTNEVVYGGNLDIIARRLPWLAVRLDEFEADLATLVRSRATTGRLLALTEHIAVDNPSDSSINRRITALSARTRLHVTPHQMRHSFGTNLLRAGVPAIVVADQMAHANLETTRGYLDTTQWYDTQEDCASSAAWGARGA
jgi:integrase